MHRPLRQPRIVAAALAVAGVAVLVATAGGQNQAARFAGVELEIVPAAGQVKGRADENV